MEQRFARAVIFCALTLVIPPAMAVGIGGPVSTGNSGLREHMGSPGTTFGNHADALSKQREERLEKRKERALKQKRSAALQGNGPLTADEAVAQAEAKGGVAVDIETIRTSTGPVFRVKLLRSNGSLRRVFINRADPQKVEKEENQQTVPAPEPVYERQVEP